MDLKAHIGARLREARLSMGITQEELAELIGKSSRTVSSIESGQSLTSLTTLQSIAAKVERPLAYFLEGFDPARRARPVDAMQRELAPVIAALSPADLPLVIAMLKVIQQHQRQKARK